MLAALPSWVVWTTGLDVVRLDFLLIFDILRVFKRCRKLKFVANVESLIHGIFRAVRSFLPVIFAVLSNSFFAEGAPYISPTAFWLFILRLKNSPFRAGTKS